MFDYGQNCWKPSKDQTVPDKFSEYHHLIQSICFTSITIRISESIQNFPNCIIIQVIAPEVYRNDLVMFTGLVKREFVEVIQFVIAEVDTSDSG